MITSKISTLIWSSEKSTIENIDYESSPLVPWPITNIYDIYILYPAIRAWRRADLLRYNLTQFGRHKSCTITCFGEAISIHIWLWFAHASQCPSEDLTDSFQTLDPKPISPKWFFFRTLLTLKRMDIISRQGSSASLRQLHRIDRRRFVSEFGDKVW